MGIVAVILLGLLLLTVGWQLVPARTSDTVIGAGQPGASGYEFVGRVDQEGLQFTGYGYLTSMRGLDPNQISTSPFTLTETTAHFTYYATATVTSRAVISNLFMLDSVGLITFYYQKTPSATFTNPLSFAGGTPIATATIDFQDILLVQSPNLGLATGMGEFTLLTVEPFALGAETYQFGRVGMVQRVSTYGQGTRTDPVLPRSFVVLAGNAVDTGQRQLFLPQFSNQSAP
jgi:hypothetical protein